MKTARIRVFSILLILLLILSMSSIVSFASTHTHRWVVDASASTSGYVSLNSTTHAWRTITVYKCADVGCSETRTESSDSALEAHYFPSETLGDHYHEGNYHYYQYVAICTDCGYARVRWEKVACNGMEPILPTNIEDDTIASLSAEEE